MIRRNDYEYDESKIPNYVRPFGKIINNSMDCEIRIMVIVLTAVEKFKRLINKTQSETEDQKIIVINPLIKYYNKELSYKCREDDLKPYSENRVNHIQKMKKQAGAELGQAQP